MGNKYTIIYHLVICWIRVRGVVIFHHISAQTIVTKLTSLFVRQCTRSSLLESIQSPNLFWPDTSFELRREREGRDGSFFCVLYKFLQANLRYRARRTHETEHTSQREASLPHVMLVTFATLWPTVWSPRIDEWQRELCRDAKCVIPYRERQNMARQQRQIWSLFRGSNSAENISSVVSVERHLPYHLEDIPVITPMSWLDSPLIWFKRIIQKKLTVNTHIMSTNKTLRNANEGGSQIWIKKWSIRPSVSTTSGLKPHRQKSRQRLAAWFNSTSTRSGTLQ